MENDFWKAFTANSNAALVENMDREATYANEIEFQKVKFSKILGYKIQIPQILRV